MPISKELAEKIAYAYREVETAEALLAQVKEAVDRRIAPDIRDAFGRRPDGLQLGVPSGENSHRLFNVPWQLARPIIETHIAAQKAIIATMSERALIEAASRRSFADQSGGQTADPSGSASQTGERPDREDRS